MTTVEAVGLSVTTKSTAAATSRTICMKSSCCHTKAWKSDSGFAAGELVGAVALQPARGLRPAQTDLNVNAQSTRDLARLDVSHRDRAHVLLGRGVHGVSLQILRPIKPPTAALGLIRCG